MKSKVITISYRPSDQIEKLFEEYCGRNALLSKTQLLEIAMQFLMMRQHDEMDRIIWKFLKGEFDDYAIEIIKENHLKNAGKTL